MESPSNFDWYGEITKGSEKCRALRDKGLSVPEAIPYLWALRKYLSLTGQGAAYEMAVSITGLVWDEP